MFRIHEINNKNTFKKKKTLFLSEAERRHNHVDYYLGAKQALEHRLCENLLHISNEIDYVTFLTNEKRKAHERARTG